MYTFYFYVHPTNNPTVLLLFAACKMTHSVEGGVEGEERISCGEPPQLNKRRSITHGVEEEKRTSLEVCSPDLARHIHAHAAQTTNGKN
jgi:hypothetical protein